MPFLFFLNRRAFYQTVKIDKGFKTLGDQILKKIL